jgi:hypothetical protein
MWLDDLAVTYFERAAVAGKTEFSIGFRRFEEHRAACGEPE